MKEGTKYETVNIVALSCKLCSENNVGETNEYQNIGLTL